MRSKFAIGIAAMAFAAAAQTPSSSRKEAGIHAFLELASVLTSPRCLNCHVPGNAPLQGDDNHPHIMKVVRGADGKGVATMRCTNCHQDANVAVSHAPPGATGWRMPSATTPMAWQGLTTAQLCRAVKDPATNGNRTLAQIVEHSQDDHIVNWGWNPGLGRSLPPLTHQQFVDAVAAWTEAGAPCPE